MDSMMQRILRMESRHRLTMSQIQVGVAADGGEGRGDAGLRYARYCGGGWVTCFRSQSSISKERRMRDERSTKVLLMQGWRRG